MKSTSELKKMAEGIEKRIAKGDNSSELYGKLVILRFVIGQKEKTKLQEL
jgi:hypothetical protein